MIILCLDLSLSSTGYSIIDDDYNLLTYGTIQTKAKEYKEEERLHIIGVAINEIIKEYNVTDLCIENSFKSVNIKTTQQLAKLQGISCYIGVDNGVKINIITPSSARKMVLGNGKATKIEVAKYIRDNYWDIGEFSDKETRTIKKTSDIFDSMLLGLCYLKKHKLEEKCSNK